MTSYYPPVGFHFRVEVLDLSANTADTRFAEVSGLSVEMTTEEVPEGGENRFVQKYPTRPKFSELTLKRGLLSNSDVWTWISDCVNDYRIAPKPVDVTLLNPSHEPLITWHLTNAYPTKWSVSDLSATNNAVVIESLQLFYQYFRVRKS